MSIEEASKSLDKFAREKLGKEVVCVGVGSDSTLYLYLESLRKTIFPIPPVWQGFDVVVRISGKVFPA